MKPQPILALLSVIWLWLFCVPAQANNPVILPQGSFDYAISPYISIYEDSSRQLDIDDIVTLKYQLFFTPSHAQSLKLGISDSNFWFRFSVTNPSDSPIKTILTLSDSDFDLLNIYQLGPNNYQEIPATDKARAVHGGMLQFFTLQINAPPQSTTTYLLQLHSIGLLTTHMSLMSADRFVANEQYFFMVLGICLGLLAMAMLCAFYIWLRFRLSIAIFTMIFCAIAIIYQLSNLGYLRLFWGVSAYHADKLAEFSLGMIYLTHILSSTSLVWIGRYHHTLKRALWGLALLAVPCAAFIILLYSQAAMPSIAILLVINSLIVFTVLLFARSTTPASQRWLLISYLVAGGTVLTLVLTSYNLLPFARFSAWGEIIIPILILVTLLMATLYQLPHQRQNSSHLIDELGLDAELFKQISQDLRTPVSSVLVSSELLQDSPLSPQQRDFNDSITHAGHDLLHLVQQMAKLSHLYNHRLEFEQQPVRLAELLNDVLNNAQVEAKRKQVELIADIHDNFPRLVQGDYECLRTVLRNLFSHTLNYVDHAIFNVEASSFQQGNKPVVRIQIILTSTIVRPETLRAAFNILQHQYPHAFPIKQQQWQLLLTRFILKQMNANVEVEGMTSQGATISLTLPVTLSPAAQTETINISRLVGKRLLIVDDSASLRAVLERQMKRWGLKTDSTYSGKEALALLRNQINLGEPYDLAILDYDMPQMNGLQLTERILQDSSIYPKPKLLMLTGVSPNGLREQALALGIDILLTKPANADFLMQALLDLIDNQDI